MAKRRLPQESRLTVTRTIAPAIATAPPAPEPEPPPVVEAGPPQLHAPAEIALLAIDPCSPAPPPGPTGPGDARSLRAGGRFALVYRSGAALVMRSGDVGQYGSWRVVHYPAPAAAATAYARACSELLSAGYRDVASA